MRNIALTIMVSFLFIQSSDGDDWLRFRGPEGSGVATDSASLPTNWSPKANLAWKVEMPGPGASSPIIVGDKAFITCYSGYGLEREEPGEIENLMRHLVCVDVKSGKKLWQKDVPTKLPEDPYTGIGVTAHGYASHTPVSDGKNVYAFFGKSGVHAFDLDGTKLWKAEVGKESDPTKWGSSSSPIVHDDLVIITASAESQAVIGFDKKSGKEVWRQEAKGLDGMWGTPTLVKVDDDRTDLVMCVSKELWGLDPTNGKMRWFADATGAQHAYSSVILDGKRVYAFTGRGGGSIAVDAGGEGDISEANTVWTGRDNASFASPVRHESKLYVIAQGFMTVVDAETGERVEKVRLKGKSDSGGQRQLDYPSPVVAGNRMFYMNGMGLMYVFELGEKAEQVALNRVTNEKEIFWGTPAISEGKMVLRSAKYLYCVADKGEEVNEEDNMLAQVEEEPAEEPAAGGRGGRGSGRSGFNADESFARMDKDSDGKVSMAELEGNRMADRLKTLDKDGDEMISKEEFTTGIRSLFSRGGGGRGGSGYGNKDTRPDRPQRPESAGDAK